MKNSSADNGMHISVEQGIERSHLCHSMELNTVRLTRKDCGKTYQHRSVPELPAVLVQVLLAIFSVLADSKS